MAPALPRSDSTGLGWFSIIRLGLVQASIGAIVMLAASLLNRVMVVEYALAAAIPAGLVAWHYAVQLARPLWGHGSDHGRSRTPWIVGGMAVLAGGALLAVRATVLLPDDALTGGALAVLAFTMIGAGVGAAGTSMLALLASGVVPERRAAAAAVTWTMMIAGIVVAAGVAGALLDPFSQARLAAVANGVALAAFALACAAIWRLEPRAMADFADRDRGDAPGFADALREIMQETAARRFTVLIFVSMLAYSMQDLILEPFAGLVFGMSPGESTQLSGLQHGGVLVGMILAGIGGSAFAGRLPVDLRLWIVAGCAGSGIALFGLAIAALAGPGWPLAANVFVLGFCNGVFAVSAIGAMMGLAGAGEKTREGVRMGVWGAAQAIAFGLGGLGGAIGVDIARRVAGQDGVAFQLIFALEASLFILAAMLAVQAKRRAPVRAREGVAAA
ncbi:BCD family MFS transporter [Alteriqipengyuania lutimaris]|uniref:MFS transporter n=1 Tax=Alteriqipengyuania lutimaris TaxID=1538146 RepID=A0A395LNY0_9SPHN|nr:BCD family MFS transporter [Alteriqipengyuania lutimaris]MBB3033788.1 BCD family chlorophyll transporter-like MFS transporter [Alteriqipengyuania lutimaris]RDS77234.1 MFS transporter [Alteriqipengyuania lutimaris]